MSTLKQLGTLVRFCQLTGLIPFTMELDPKTGQFLRFAFSWRHYVTWYCLGLFLLQLTGFATIMTAMRQFTNGEEFNNVETQLPISVVILIGVAATFQFFTIVLAKTIVLRHASFRKISAILKKVEEHLLELPNCKNSVLRRTLFGFFLIELMNVLLLFASFPMVRDILDPMGSFTIPLVCALQLSLTTMLSCYALVLHLSYYVIAHYIHLLRETLLVTDDSSLECVARTKLLIHDNQLQFRRDLDRLKKSQYIFGLLCKATTELNRVFSFPAFFIISTKLVTSVYSSFSVIYQLMKPNPLLRRLFWIAPVSLLVDLTIILNFFIAADMPVHQTFLLREQIIAESNAKIERDHAYKVKVVSFLKQLDEDRIRLTACGLFNVGVHLVPALVGAIITYLVILLQTQTQ